MVTPSFRTAVSMLAALPMLLLGTPARADRPAPVLAIEHVTVIPMTGEHQTVHDVTVLIRAGRIVAIGNRIRIPARARRWNGRGQFLIPGLSDMHVHLEDASRIQRATESPPLPENPFDTADILLPYLANGILQLFDLSATPRRLRQRQEVENQSVLGPHIAAASMVDGDPPVHVALATPAATPEAGRELVRAINRDGYNAVKVYQNLNFETFAAILDEARRLRLRVVGHFPLRFQDRTGELLRPGFNLIAHAEEYAYRESQV
jgi:hypothetical protein